MYFHRTLLPPDLQDRHGRELVGKRVEFQFLTTKDGKDRCDRLWMLDGPDNGNRRRGGRLPPLDMDRNERRRRDREPEVPPADLEPPLVEEMRQFLEEKGGVMDYGRFSNHFTGLKKVQLEPHFTLVPEVQGQGGGRWQIMLEGVAPLTPEERAERERNERQDDADGQQVGDVDGVVSEEVVGPNDIEDDGLIEEEFAPLLFEPSPTLRLIGSIASWDRRSLSGTVFTEGYDEVVVDNDALPSEVQGRKDIDLTGCELTFELVNENGQLQARNAHLLLQPDGDGGWQLRFVN